MEVIPAIDLRDGRCVRLYQGDYARETVFADDPVAMAQRWQAAGAVRLHVVDLDGAAAGRPVNGDVVRRIVAAVSIPVQLGGGLRTLADIAAALEAGVARAILGTAAIEDEALLEEACRRYGDAIAVAIDARGGVVAVRGWREATTVEAVVLASRVIELGARRLIYTDVLRDGTLTGPNVEATAALVAAVPVPVIASGGVSSLDDLRRLAAVGVEGAIVGQALYTGAIDLAEAIAAVAMLA